MFDFGRKRGERLIAMFAALGLLLFCSILPASLFAVDFCGIANTEMQNDRLFEMLDAPTVLKTHFISIEQEHGFSTAPPPQVPLRPNPAPPPAPVKPVPQLEKQVSQAQAPVCTVPMSYSYGQNYSYGTNSGSRWEGAGAFGGRGVPVLRRLRPRNWFGGGRGVFRGRFRGGC